MSFTISCNNCGSKMEIRDKEYYLGGNGDKIEILPYSETDYYDTTIEYFLELFCMNKECENTIKINC